MAKSIVQNDKVCYITGDEYNLHKHHVFGGSNRRKSERLGLWIYLRADWHNMEKYGIHNDAKLNREIKAKVQKIAMEHYDWTTEDFIREFGKNYC